MPEHRKPTRLLSLCLSQRRSNAFNAKRHRCFFSILVGLGDFVATAVMAVLVIWGRGFLSLLPALRLCAGGGARRCEELLYGSVGFSVLGFFGVLLGVRLPITFSVGTVLALVAVIAHWRRPVPVVQTTANVLEIDRWVGWLAPLLIVVGSLIWSINNFRGIEQSGDTIVLTPWVDFFFHARPIASFGHFQGDSGFLHWSMYGMPLPAYHYAGYMGPALVANLGDVPAIQIATSVYPVVGMVLSGAAMFVLAQASGGPRVALIAVILLFFLPDISSVLPGQSRQSSYFFFQQVGVGGAYAVAVLGLALALVLKAGRDGSILPAACGASLLAASVFFKAQIFLAYGVFFAVFTIYVVVARKRPRLALALIVTTFVLYAIAVSRLGTISNAPTLSISLAGMRQDFGRAFGFEHSGLAATLGSVAMIPPMSVAVLFVAYGLLLPVLFLSMWRLRREPEVRRTIVLALFWVAAHLFVRLLIDNNRGFGDIAEINRKTFVWPYFVVVYASAMLLVRMTSALSRLPFASDRLSCRLVGGGSVALMMLLSFAAAARLQAWPGTSESFSKVEIPRGLIASAAYLRAASARSDVVQLCENDRYNELASLTERPVFVAKLMVNGTPLTKAESDRFAAVDKVLHQPPTAAAAIVMARELGINWFVLTPECRPGWEAGATDAFVSNGYRVIDMRR